MLPRWGGDSGDIAALAVSAREKLKPEPGFLCYGLIAEAYLAEENPVGLVAEGFDLEVIEDAAQLMLRSYPESSHAHNFAVIVSVLRSDHASAAGRFRVMAGDVNVAMWKDRSIYDKFLQWSHGIHVAAQPSSEFLASWKGLRQVAFGSDGAELSTLSLDPMQEIHLRDPANPKLDRTVPLPFGLQPLFMGYGSHSSLRGTLAASSSCVAGHVDWPQCRYDERRCNDGKSTVERRQPVGRVRSWRAARRV